MGKNISLNDYTKMNKTVLIFSELLAIFLILGSSLVLLGTLLPDSQKNIMNQNNSSLKPEIAPENPKFIEYHQNKIFTLTKMTPNGHKSGIIPTPVILSLSRQFSTPKASFPTYYDLRTLNKVTQVKNQGQAGSCWTFATYASLESYLEPKENWDFSENNMKNVLSNIAPEGFDSIDGGNEHMSTAYLAGWNGPMSESSDPYSDLSAYTSTELGLSVQKHVQNVYYLPDRTGSLDNNEIKSGIQNYGALYTSMYYDQTCDNSTTHSYYYNGSADSNHAISIVGWNDNFNRNNFSEVPPGNGAFIIKNSWGTSYGENGYFYVSYYDSNIGKDNTIFTSEETSNYEKIYQYDPLGLTETIGYSNPSCWCANIFTAKSDENLKAVSFYTTDSNCNYLINIYTNSESSPIDQANLAFSETGTSTFAGYHTIPLGIDVPLNAGQKFSVVLKLTNSKSNFPVALEMPISTYSSKATANPGESFISSDGKTWEDITAYSPNTNVCIKAFTAPRGTILPLANFSASPISGYVPLAVTFTDKSTNSPTSWSWNFGDNGTSTVENPSHTYTTAGTYAVSLTATNMAGSNDVTKSGYILISSLIAPVASFAASTTTGTTTSAITFTDTSTNKPFSWSWNFGDNSAKATTMNVSHTFSKAGTYTVTLTVMNATGNASISKTIIIVTKPVASFTVSPTSGGTTATTFTFTDTSINTPTTWTWDFGDGGIGSGKSITHAYSTAKTYTVSLTAGNTAGNATATKSIVMNSAVLKPVGSFAVSPTSGGTTATTYTFTDTSTYTPNSWSWKFSDGGVGTGKIITHKFTKSGTLTVSLTVGNSAGGVTVTKSVKVADVKPVASFNYLPTTLKHGTLITFTDTSSNIPTAWKWTYSDTSSAQTTKITTHTFAKAGSYKVTLTASNTAGSSAVTKTIKVS